MCDMNAPNCIKLVIRLESRFPIYLRLGLHTSRFKRAIRNNFILTEKLHTREADEATLSHSLRERLITKENREK